MHDRTVADNGAFLHQADRWLSRQDFLDRVARAADGFAKMGLRAGDSVAILMRNDLPFLEASLAAKAVGGVAVPINWHSTAPEIAYVLDDCRARVIVGHADLLAKAGRDALPVEQVLAVKPPSDVAMAYGLDTAQTDLPPWTIEWDCWLAAHSIAPLGFSLASDSMLYTSGTTGRPKGVRRQAPTSEQKRLIDETRKSVYGVRPGAKILVPGPLYHGAPNGIALHAARVASTVVLMERFDPECFLGVIEKHRIDSIFMVPTMFNRLLKLEQSVRQRYDLSSLTFILHAAAPCPPDLKRQMIDWLGPIIHEFYGGTESGPCAFCTSAEWLRHPGTVGKILDNATVKIFDANGNECPTGEAGEIYMRLHHYPDFTYHGLDEKRLEIERDGLITLGDIGYLNADGFLFLCDRKRDMVIVGGANIYPAEIESVLLGMPGVRDCAVFGVPDDDYGEALLALVEPCEDILLTVSSIQDFLEGRLKGFKLPRRIEIRRDLPRQDSGKIFKRALRAPYWEGVGRHI